MNTIKDTNIHVDDVVDSTTYNLMCQAGYTGDTPCTLECLRFINMKDKNYLLFLDYDEKLDCWQFIVVNKQIKYRYKQPPTPGMDIKTALRWGFDHILNRLI